MRRVRSDGYWAYACPRCLNGTLAWDNDRYGDPFYLKCILCGKEVWPRKFYQKTDKEVSKKHKLKQNSKVKRDYKWQMGTDENKTV